jgi:hypothetical protein
MYEDMKENMAKVRKNKRDTHHQNNQNSNYGRSKPNNYSNSNTNGENPSKNYNSYTNSTNGNYKNLMSQQTYPNYSQMPNSVEQMQMQLRMMQMNNMYINQYESYGIFIRKAVESSDEDEKKEEVKSENEK